MKAMWLAQMAKLDALSLRERAFLFLTVLVCAGAVFDAVWLSPARGTHKQLLTQLEAQETDLQRLRALLKASAQPTDSTLAGRADLQKTDAALAQTNLEIKALLPGAEQAPLEKALVHLLQRHEGLKLLKTAALPVEVAGPGASSGTGLPEGLMRQGVTLSVAGPYAELVRYVSALEVAMPHVRWGVMELKIDNGLPELTLQLHLLSEVAR